MADSALVMAEMCRDAIKAKLEGGAVASYSINGRSLANTPLRDLIALEKEYRALAAAEASSSRTNVAEFKSPG